MAKLLLCVLVLALTYVSADLTCSQISRWERNLKFTYVNLPFTIRIVDKDQKITSAFVPGKASTVILRALQHGKFNGFVLEARQVGDSVASASWSIPEDSRQLNTLSCNQKSMGTLINGTATAVDTVKATFTVPESSQITQLEIIAIVRHTSGRSYKFRSTELFRVQKKAEVAGGEEARGQEEEAAKPTEERNPGPTENPNEPELRQEQERKAAEDADRRGPAYRTSLEYERAQALKERQRLRQSIDADLRGSEDEYTKKEAAEKRRRQEEYRKEQLDAERLQSVEQRKREEIYRQELRDWEEFQSKKKTTTLQPEIEVDEKIVIIDEDRGQGDKPTSGSAKVVVAIGTIVTALMAALL